MLTTQQLKARKAGIGATDVAKICGLSQYGSPLSVYLDKTTNEIEETPPTIAQRQGSYLEPLVMELYAEEFNVPYLMKDETLYAHKEKPYLITHIDYSHQNRLIECKTSSGFVNSWREDKIPEAVEIQCAHEAYVYESATGNKIEFVDIPLLMNCQLKIFRYTRNPELEEALQFILSNFWENHVLMGKPPLIDASYAEVSRLTSSIPNTSIVANPDTKECLKKIAEAKRHIAEEEARLDCLKSQLALFIGENEALVDDNKNVLATFKSFQRNSFNTLRFKKEYPDLYQAYLKSGSSRVLRIKGEA